MVGRLHKFLSEASGTGDIGSPVFMLVAYLYTCIAVTVVILMMKGLWVVFKYVDGLVG